MRKIALLLTLCIMLSLAACGRSEADMPLQENDMDEYTQTSGESETPVESEELLPEETEEILPEESSAPQLPEVNFEKITEFTKVGETDSGYTGSATVVFYNAIRNLEGSFAHPADSSVTVEVPSNEENYYILPFEITVKNASEGFDAPARLKLTVRENKNIIGGCKDYELPGYISSVVTNVYVRVFYCQNKTWEEDSNDMLPASPYFSEMISWDNFAGGKEYKQLGYLLISDVVSPKYPDGLPWYIYPNMSLTASLYLDNLHAVAAEVMIMKEDDGSATGRYTVIDATDSEALDAVWAKSKEMLESLEE